MEVSDLTKKRIEEMIAKGERIDKRKPLEFRPITIEYNIAKQAEGSARVKIGDTEVIAGVKLGAITPFTDSPDEGCLMVAAELWPLASDKFEMGPPSIQAIELARIIDRGIRESHCIDMKKLCIKEGELVWAVYVDIYPINDDGNLIDAGALAAIAALKNAVLPAIEGEKIKYGEHTNKKLPLNKVPITLTFYKIGKSFILDPTVPEEESIKSRLSIAMTFDKEDLIHAMQKAGDDPLTEAEVSEILDIAVREGKKLAENLS
jgi:exosome complex component RRP42